MTGSQPTLTQLRPALQLALETAVSSSEPLPGRVRNLVRNRRLPANWAPTMRQVIEEDDAFRAVVAAVATEEGLGRLAWLWLARPEGWSDELDGLVQAAVDADDQEKVLRRAEERIAELEAEVTRMRAEAAASSSIHEELIGELDGRRRTVGSLEAGLERARAELAETKVERDSARARIDDLQDDNDRLRRDLRELRSRLSDLTAAQAEATAAVARAEAGRSALAESHERLDSENRMLKDSLGGAVARAADAARQLGEALAEASGALGTSAVPASRARPSDPSPAPRFTRMEDIPGRTRPATRRRPRPASSGRHPLALPPAVFDDSPEAAAYLVRAPGVHLVVDGYNVTFTSWTGDDLPALRNRLVMALSELAVRVQRTVTVVFDGADDGGRVPPPPVARPWLRILFSASTVEADEVIVEAVRALDPKVPVVVATDDRQVRRDVANWGANVLSVEQLLAVLGRQKAPWAAEPGRPPTRPT